ncbi:RHS repeat domain-containing protein [Segatella copri]|uniref:RHS repeat protein n=2 Tax=Bacteroidales TaxID=171549 RepID=A0AA92U8Q1_9BACT|nr:RHS repeat domain-containing protein [Segatella copri]MCW4082275.1 RHS repeat protein [Segatella copri]RGW74386.1 hypothetical protein DWV53_14450 [Segatella copri]
MMILVKCKFRGNEFTFSWDGIQRLVRVTDTEGNVTTSTYDMGDRRTEVNHPASGITSLTRMVKIWLFTIDF